MTTSHVENSAVIHPVVVAKVTGYKFRALLDSGVTYSYASSTLVTLTKAELKASGDRNAYGADYEDLTRVQREDEFRDR